MAKAPSLTISPDRLTELLREIEEIDNTLDAQAGSISAGKRKVENELVEQYEGTWSQATSQLEDNLNDMSDEDLAGVVLGIERFLRDKFGERVSKVVEAQVEARKSQKQEKLSEDQLEKLTEARKGYVKEYGVIRSLLEMSGIDVADVPEPKVRRGSVGPKGPRTLSTFDYFINGEKMPDDQNSISGVAKRYGMASKELKETIESQVDFKLKKGDVPHEWSVELPNGDTLSATRQEQYRDEFGPTEEDEAEAA